MRADDHLASKLTNKDPKIKSSEKLEKEENSSCSISVVSLHAADPSKIQTNNELFFQHHQQIKVHSMSLPLVQQEEFPRNPQFSSKNNFQVLKSKGTVPLDGSFEYLSDDQDEKDNQPSVALKNGFKQISPELNISNNGKKWKKTFKDENNQLKVKLTVEKKYKPFQIPPDWDAAQRHAVARQVGRNKTPQINCKETYEVCPCCDYQVEKLSLSMRNQVTELSFLGSGYPLFFHYMKYCIVILGIILLTSGQYNLLSNYFGRSCIDKSDQQKQSSSLHPCVIDWISIWSIANKNKKVDYAEIQDILNFTTIIVVMILLMFFRKEQKEIDSQCDMAEITPSDYSVMLRGLPNWTTKRDIREFLEQNEKQFPGKIKVTEINLVYNLAERIKKQETINNLISQKQKALSKIEFSHEFIAVGNKWDQVIEKEQRNLDLINFKIQGDPTYFSGAAFVSFQTEDQKEIILDSATETSLFHELLNGIFFQSNEFRKLKFGLIDIEVSEAPEPLDIIWENLYQTKGVKSLRRFLSFTITLMLFGVCIALVYLLIKYQADSMKAFNKEHKDDFARPDLDMKSSLTLLFWEQLPTAIVSFCMVCINSFIIEILIRQIVKIESHNTCTLFNINIAQKLSLALFINTALITCFFNLFYTENVFGKGGLIYTIFYFFVVNAGTSFISLLFDPILYLRKVLVYFYKRQGQRCNLTQDQANKLCEYPLHQIEIGYVDIMKTMYITIFYSPVVPFGLVISLIGFCVYYWSQKYVVLKQSQVDKQVSVKLSLEMTEYLEYIISIYTASNLIFKYETVGEISYLQITGFIIGCIYSILPIQVFIDKFFFFGNTNEVVSYEDAYAQFLTTYSMSNPITEKEAKKRSQQKNQLAYLNTEP